MLALLLGIASSIQAWGAQSVSLTWDPSPDTNVVGYIVNYGTTSGHHPCRMNVGNVTNATVTGLQEGFAYYFTATACNAEGLESVPSNELAYVVPGAMKLTSAATRTSPARITFPVAPGRSYVIEASHDLKSWQQIGATTGTTNDWVQFTDLQSPAFKQRFYRLLLVQ